MADENRMSMFEEDGDAAPGGAAEMQGDVSETPAEPEPELLAEPETGEKEPEAPAEALPPDADPNKHAHNVPITVVLDEREKRQAAERRAEQVERQLAEFERQKRMAEQQQAPPDIFENPDARMAWERHQVAQQQWSQKLDVSEMMARQAYGDETVEAAQQAFLMAAQSNPALTGALQSQRHPYDYVVKWHKREQFLQEVGDDPEAYKKRLIEEARAAIPASPTPKAPPASLAAAPSAGKHEPGPVLGTSALPSLFGTG